MGRFIVKDLFDMQAIVLVFIVILETKLLNLFEHWTFFVKVSCIIDVVDLQNIFIKFMFTIKAIFMAQK